MNQISNADRYSLLFSELQQTVTDTEKRITADPPETYVVNHVNFLTKSFLISLCCYLESFLKEIANEHVTNAKRRILSAQVPHNLLIWSLNREVKDKDLRSSFFDLPVTKKDIDDELSGNPFRTAKYFRYLGIDLESVAEFTANKDLVNMVVAKRNNIIHHNESATDISLGDIRTYSGHFKVYVKAIANAVQYVELPDQASR